MNAINLENQLSKIGNAVPDTDKYYTVLLQPGSRNDLPEFQFVPAPECRNLSSIIEDAHERMS